MSRAQGHGLTWRAFGARVSHGIQKPPTYPVSEDVRLNESKSASKTLAPSGHREGGMKEEGMHNTTPFGSWARATHRLMWALATGWMLLHYLATPASGYEAAPTLQAS